MGVGLAPTRKGAGVRGWWLGAADFRIVMNVPPATPPSQETNPPAFDTSAARLTPASQERPVGGGFEGASGTFTIGEPVRADGPSAAAAARPEVWGGTRWNETPSKAARSRQAPSPD